MDINDVTARWMYDDELQAIMFPEVCCQVVEWTSESFDAAQSAMVGTINLIKRGRGVV